ncbi:hypothetical protein XELAEV_18033734mg [Xenopus laevis]|uniref:Uncharacterized protein n=1 Tax=Xenopus laevis TaxID=8355 RepID=A0A974HE84_XENLA|nr:hypothetical protein XELAEV_18033734mg [Xenopus laevis]
MFDITCFLIYVPPRYMLFPYKVLSRDIDVSVNILVIIYVISVTDMLNSDMSYTFCCKIFFFNKLPEFKKKRECLTNQAPLMKYSNKELWHVFSGWLL